MSVPAVEIRRLRTARELAPVVAEHAERLEELEEQVAGDALADRIAARVLEDLRTRRWTLAERLGGLVVVAAAVGTFVLQLLTHHAH